jgi:CubicO group peptidase (beta-lactamase class C family)
MFNTTQALIARHIAEDSYSGAAIAVVQRGKFLLEHYAGMARPDLTASSDSLWPLASISKLYSVTAIMRLIEQGVLTVNTPAHHVLPECSGDGKEEIRLRHLLTHTSGLIYESPEMEARLAAQTPMSDLVSELYTTQLKFRPGTRHSYADYNTLLAARMAEVATGTPFAKLVQSLVLAPARLLQTYFPVSEAALARTAHVRGVMAEGTDGAMYNSAYALGLAHPAFGVAATVTDLAQFGMLFAPTATGSRLLARNTMRAMTSDQTGGAPGEHVGLRGLPENIAIPFGLGFMLQTPQAPAVMSEFASMRAFGHGGASGCWLLIDPDIDLVIAFVSNAHVRLGRDAWSRRIQSVFNTIFAAVTA